MQITQYYCDSCGKEIKDDDKNLVFVGDIYCNDSLDGGHKLCAHKTRLFCENCAFKLFELILDTNEAIDITSDWLGKDDKKN